MSEKRRNLFSDIHGAELTSLLAVRSLKEDARILEAGAELNELQVRHKLLCFYVVATATSFHSPENLGAGKEGLGRPVT